MTVVVRRSALKMWVMAMGGIPLVVLGLDVVTNRRITNAMRDVLFRPEDTQIFEPRDEIWAWALLAFGAFLVLWGLKELFVPTRVLETTPEGLALRVGGPLGRTAVVPWDQVLDVDTTTVEDEGRKVPHLVVEVADSSILPDNPWGARWLGDGELAILAEDWGDDPRRVADGVADYAVDVALKGSEEE